MKKAFSSLLQQTGGLFRSNFFAGVLAIIFASGLPLLGCRCPEADHPRVIPDSPRHADLMKATIDNAQAKKTWTRDDEATFRKSLAHLSPETRMASALRLSALINSRAVIFERSPSKPPAPPMCTCPCTPATCERATTPRSTVQPPAANVPPPGAPPATKAK